MPSEIKEKFISDLTEDLKGSGHLVVTEYQGLTTDELNGLRAQLATVGSKYKIVKNRLAKLVLKKIGWGAIESSLKGPSALAYHGQDSAAMTKILFKFSEDHKNLKVKSGHLFGNAVDLQVLKTIATLPSKEVLLATLLARLNSPLQSLLLVLNEPMRALHASLTAVAKNKESTPAA